MEFFACCVGILLSALGDGVFHTNGFMVATIMFGFTLITMAVTWFIKEVS